MTVEADIQVRRVFVPLFEPNCPRFMVVVAHRRAGKTTAALQKLIADALRVEKPNGRFAFVAPLRVQAKTVAWDMLKRMTKGLPGTEINESELRADLFNGARIQLYGSDNPDALRGGYLDGCVMDEFAQTDPRAWVEVIRPMLADRKGWAVFIGTPAGRNTFADLYDRAATDEGWGRLFLQASQTGLVAPEELAAAKREMSPEAYEQEFELSFTAAIRGAFYGSLMERAEADGRVCDLPYIPEANTVTAWDLGVRDATAIWILQQDGPWWNAVDYIESSGVGLDWYAQELKSRMTDHGWHYDMHIAPPDIAVVELGTGRSRIETARGMGLHFTVCRQHRVADGIQAVRSMLPRMRFDRVRCERGIKALQLYRQEWDARLGALRANPLHDWSSHASDSIRYFAMTDANADTWDETLTQPAISYRRR